MTWDTILIQLFGTTTFLVIVIGFWFGLCIILFMVCLMEGIAWSLANRTQKEKQNITL